MRATMLQRATALAAALVLASTMAAPASAQVLRVAEMTADDIRSLDRERTVVILPGGVLEQHGPYLPSYTDGYMNEWWTARLAEAIVSRPGWTALVFPMIPLGNGGANEMGGVFVFPGTYSVRTHTLRAVFMDLGVELGEQGFRRVFVVHNHGSPVHNRALDQAGEFFRDTYGGFMVNLTGLEPDEGPADPQPAAELQAENGAIDAHAGLSETSRMLFLRPGLVDPDFTRATSLPATSPEELLRIARSDGWPGYLGAPRLATPAFGAAVMRARSDRFIRTALAILDGLDPATIPRYADSAMQRESVIVEGILLNDTEREAAQDAWLRGRGYR